MYVTVVYNRLRDDVVDCRIRVPESEATKALHTARWPQYNRCRAWQKQQHRQSSASGGQSNQSSSESSSRIQETHWNQQYGSRYCGDLEDWDETDSQYGNRY